MCSTISKNLFLWLTGCDENCGETRERAEEFHIHISNLEREANCNDQQGELEENVKYLPEILECGQASGSSNGIKGMEACYFTEPRKENWKENSLC